MFPEGSGTCHHPRARRPRAERDRARPGESAHIIPFAQEQQHAFENIIRLCAVCHSRYDRGEIDRQVMLGYKANLSLLNNRYGELERRVLQAFGDEPEVAYVDLPGNMGLLMRYLERDGLVVSRVSPNNAFTASGGPGDPVQVGRVAYWLAEKGKAFVQDWMQARPLASE